MKRTLIVLLALSLLSLTGCSRRGADWDLDQARCNFPSWVGFLWGSVECYRLTVPENHANPDGREIELGVYLIKAHRRTDEPPIIYLQGGPGGGVGGALWWLLRHPIRNVRDVIYLDQRGAGVSRSFCEDFEAELYWNIGPLNDLDLRDRYYERAIVACTTSALGQGVDIQHYNMQQSALDMRDLRHALGLEELDLWGVSYGTALAQAYMKVPGEVIGTVLFDGFLPIDGWRESEQPRNMANVLDSVWQHCVSQGVCSPTGETYLDRVLNISEQYRNRPLRLTLYEDTESAIYNYILPTDVVVLVFMHLYYHHAHVELPTLLAELEARDRDALSSRVEMQFDPDFSFGAFWVGRCQGMRSTPEEIQVAYKEYPQLSDLLEIDSATVLCDLLNLEPPDRDTFEVARFDGRMLVMTGEWDPITPNSRAYRVANRFPKATIVDVPFGGHGVSLGLPCARQLVADYFESGSTELTVSCELAYGED